MHTEYEAKFLDVEKGEVRAQLRKAGAVMERPEFLQRRWVFDLPKEKHSRNKFARVRDEGNVVTLTWKEFSGEEKDHPREIELIVDSFDNAVELLKELGCVPASHQESYRELWNLGGVKITIDTWPFFNPFVEVEGASEEVVRAASEQLGFAWNTARFCGVNRLFQERYGEHVHLQKIPTLTFTMPNPF